MHLKQALLPGRSAVIVVFEAFEFFGSERYIDRAIDFLFAQPCDQPAKANLTRAEALEYVSPEAGHTSRVRVLAEVSGKQTLERCGQSC
jgi:hypothetical protein